MGQLDHCQLGVLTLYLPFVANGAEIECLFSGKVNEGFYWDNRSSVKSRKKTKGTWVLIEKEKPHVYLRHAIQKLVKELREKRMREWPAF